MLKDALQFWDAIAGKVKQLIRGETQNAFRCERYEVSTAPNGSVVGVQKPYGEKELFLPYSAEVADATVGTPVLVVWWGSMSNAKVYYMADGFKGSSGGGTAPVQSVNGQTGAVELDAADVGAMSEWDLLWENASPNSDFAGQTISFDATDYSVFAVVYVRQTGTGHYFCNFIKDKLSNMMQGSTYADSNWYYITVLRFVTLSNSGAQFGDAIMGAHSTGGAYVLSTRNDMAVPYKIYGAKG